MTCETCPAPTDALTPPALITMGGAETDASLGPVTSTTLETTTMTTTTEAAGVLSHALSKVTSIISSVPTWGWGLFALIVLFGLIAMFRRRDVYIHHDQSIHVWRTKRRPQFVKKPRS